MMQAILALALLVVSTAAFGQEPVAAPEVVTIPYGEWISKIVDIALPAFGTLLTGIASYVVAAYVPPWLKAITGQRGQQRINEVINKAVMSAVGQTKGAVLGKALEVPVANDVLRRAMQYAVDQAPELIKSAARDNVENLAKMVMARMTEWGLLPANYSNKNAAPAASAPVVDQITGKPVAVNPVVYKRPAASGDFSFEDAINKGFGKT